MSSFGRGLAGALAACCIVGGTAVACSIFSVSIGDRVLFGNNVDDGNPNTFYEVVPAEDEGDLGFITLGFNDPQGGLNEAGLAFDTNAVPASPLTPNPGLPRHPAGTVGIAVEMLRRAATVDEALAIARSYDWGEELRNQWLFADATGDAVVISAGSDGELAFTRKAPGDGFLISTNINRDREAMLRFCWRYRTIDRSLGRLLDRGELSVDAVSKTLDAAHQEAVFLRDGVLLNTVYSNVFDLRTREITLVYWFQFDEPLTLRLEDELAKGAKRVRVRDLFPRELVLRVEEINAAHLERIDRWRTFPWLSTGVALAVIAAIVGWALLRD